MKKLPQGKGSRGGRSSKKGAGKKTRHRTDSNYNRPRKIEPIQFSPDTAPVSRLVLVTAPPQMLDDGLHEITVNALPLYGPKSPPPDKKGISDFVGVIHPQVIDRTTGQPVTRFKPAITISIPFTDADVERARKFGGGLKIVTFWEDGDITRWQKLPTKVDRRRHALTAQLDTLEPEDPIGMGSP